MTEVASRPRRGAGFTIGVTALALLLVGTLCGLGWWQVRRLAWKHELIARVDTRIHAAPRQPPAIAGRDDEYRRVVVTGRFLNDRATLVQASTERGAGFWVMTPLLRDDGGITVINRGFVPTRSDSAYERPATPARVIGLLRLTEPGGGFLRSNDPAAGRWYSRDIVAIAARQNLVRVDSSYFIDVEAQPRPDALPAGGMTVVHFPDNHLLYALTWFTLAAMVVAGYIIVMKDAARKQRP